MEILRTQEILGHIFMSNPNYLHIFLDRLHLLDRLRSSLPIHIHSRNQEPDSRGNCCPLRLCGRENCPGSSTSGRYRSLRGWKALRDFFARTSSHREILIKNCFLLFGQRYSLGSCCRIRNGFFNFWDPWLYYDIGIPRILPSVYIARTSW